jgi:hypothetical protein
MRDAGSEVQDGSDSGTVQGYASGNMREADSDRLRDADPDHCEMHHPGISARLIPTPSEGNYDTTET